MAQTATYGTGFGSGFISPSPQLGAVQKRKLRSTVLDTIRAQAPYVATARANKEKADLEKRAVDIQAGSAADQAAFNRQRLKFDEQTTAANERYQDTQEELGRRANDLNNLRLDTETTRNALLKKQGERADVMNKVGLGFKVAGAAEKLGLLEGVKDGIKGWFSPRGEFLETVPTATYGAAGGTVDPANYFDYTPATTAGYGAAVSPQLQAADAAAEGMYAGFGEAATGQASAAGTAAAEGAATMGWTGPVGIAGAGLSFVASRRENQNRVSKQAMKIGNTISGLAAGAYIGSFAIPVPVVGTAIGAVVGGVAGAIK